MENYSNNNSNSDETDEVLNTIKADIDSLEQIARTYNHTHDQLKELAFTYDKLLKRAKVNIRRKQLGKILPK